MNQNENQKLPYHTYIYMLCQAFGLVTNMITVMISAIVGRELAPDPIYATIPYGMQYVALLVGTYPMALIMKKYGRRFGFLTGTSSLALSGLVGFYAIQHGNFYLLIVTHSLQGFFIASSNYYRYGATDGLPTNLHAPAIATVIGGGLIGAFIAPEVVNTFKDTDGYATFALCYLAFVGLAIILTLLLMIIPFEKSTPESDNKSTLQSTKESDTSTATAKAKIDFTGINTALLSVAIVSGGIGFLLMKILMVEASLHMKDVGIAFLASTHAIKWHVIGMFAPSLISGWLINKLGHRTIIFTGVGIFLACFALNLTDPDNYTIITIGLILLGVAWNFTYVGGSALLATTVKNTPQEKQIQGMGDTIIAAMAAVGATLPSILYTTIGWNGTNITAFVIALIAGGYIVVRYKKQDSTKKTA